MVFRLTNIRKATLVRNMVKNSAIRARNRSIKLKKTNFDSLFDGGENHFKLTFSQNPSNLTNRQKIWQNNRIDVIEIQSLDLRLDLVN